MTKLYLFIILSGIIPEIEDGNFKFKLEASKLYDIIICKVFYFPTLWSLNSAHWENIQKEQARKLQATLVPVRNYHRLTYLIADGGEV